MPLYHWSSKAIAQYRNGDIIVIASSVAQARKRAVAHAMTWLRENRDWYFNADGTATKERQPDVDYFLGEIRADLACEPEVVTVVFIEGSE